MNKMEKRIKELKRLRKNWKDILKVSIGTNEYAETRIKEIDKELTSYKFAKLKEKKQ